MPGGGLMLEEVTVETWLKTSSRLIGATCDFFFLRRLVPLLLEVSEY